MGVGCHLEGTSDLYLAIEFEIKLEIGSNVAFGMVPEAGTSIQMHMIHLHMGFQRGAVTDRCEGGRSEDDPS